MSEWLSTLDNHWAWLSIGLLVGAAEIVAPGFFLIWIAIAAIIVGLIAWALSIWGLEMSIALQIGLFAVLSILTVYAGKRWFYLNPIETSDPKLNDRGARLVGEVLTVTEAIVDGRGRVQVGDTQWSARGENAAMGSRVRVTGADGAVLLVENAGA